MSKTDEEIPASPKSPSGSPTRNVGADFVYATVKRTRSFSSNSPRNLSSKLGDPLSSPQPTNNNDTSGSSDLPIRRSNSGSGTPVLANKTAIPRLSLGSLQPSRSDSHLTTTPRSGQRSAGIVVYPPRSGQKPELADDQSSTTPGRDLRDVSLNDEDSPRTPPQRKGTTPYASPSVLLAPNKAQAASCQAAVEAARTGNEDLLRALIRIDLTPAEKQALLEEDNKRGPMFNQLHVINFCIAWLKKQKSILITANGVPGSTLENWEDTDITTTQGSLYQLPSEAIIPMYKEILTGVAEVRGAGWIDNNKLTFNNSAVREQFVKAWESKLTRIVQNPDWELVVGGNKKTKISLRITLTKQTVINELIANLKRQVKILKAEAEKLFDAFNKPSTLEQKSLDLSALKECAQQALSDQDPLSLNPNVPVNWQEPASGDNLVLTALKYNQFGILPNLLQLGANPLLPNKNRETALSYVVDSRNKENLRHINTHLRQLLPLDFLGLEIDLKAHPNLKPIIDKLLQIKAALDKYGSWYEMLLNMERFSGWERWFKTNITDAEFAKYGAAYANLYVLLYEKTAMIKLDIATLYLQLPELLKKIKGSPMYSEFKKLRNELGAILNAPNGNFTTHRDKFISHTKDTTIAQQAQEIVSLEADVQKKSEEIVSLKEDVQEKSAAIAAIETKMTAQITDSVFKQLEKKFEERFEAQQEKITALERQSHQVSLSDNTHIIWKQSSLADAPPSTTTPAPGLTQGGSNE